MLIPDGSSPTVLRCLTKENDFTYLMKGYNQYSFTQRQRDEIGD